MKELKALFNIIILFGGLAMLISGGSCAVFSVVDSFKATVRTFRMDIFITLLGLEIALIGCVLIIHFWAWLKATTPENSNKIKHYRNIAVFLIGLNTLAFGGFCGAWDKPPALFLVSAVGVGLLLMALPIWWGLSKTYKPDQQNADD